MLIVDFYTLKAVNSLNLLNHVVLNGADPLNLQNVMRIHATFGQLVTGLK